MAESRSHRQPKLFRGRLHSSTYQMPAQSTSCLHWNADSMFGWRTCIFRSVVDGSLIYYSKVDRAWPHSPSERKLQQLLWCQSQHLLVSSIVYRDVIWVWQFSLLSEPFVYFLLLLYQFPTIPLSRTCKTDCNLSFPAHCCYCRPLWALLSPCIALPSQHSPTVVFQCGREIWHRGQLAVLFSTAKMVIEISLY